MWRLIKEDVLGMEDFEWTQAVQRQMKLTRAQVKELESGNIVRTALRGGTEFYLAKDPETVQAAAEKQAALRGMKLIPCPACGGTGRIEEKLSGGKKTA